jgi:hypothetical protein
VTANTPSSGATGVSRTTTVTATFSRAMDASTINGTTFTLTGPSGAVPATVSYDSATRVATLTLSAPPLTGSTSYTARLDGSIRASDSLTLAGPVTWSFTTEP